jgi:hypothetical protein
MRPLKISYALAYERDDHEEGSVVIHEDASLPVSPTCGGYHGSDYWIFN